MHSLFSDRRLLFEPCVWDRDCVVLYSECKQYPTATMEDEDTYCLCKALYNASEGFCVPSVLNIPLF